MTGRLNNKALRSKTHVFHRITVEALSKRIEWQSNSIGPRACHLAFTSLLQALVDVAECAGAGAEVTGEAPQKVVDQVGHPLG
ncbi:hypothetical protein [Streptacidiphilus pinicola]|uniref:hypothetical protein n=1 Tax=Streptacidiphilus pinicola TaxID=2219663 RepID=UPI0010576326|nr:hypothetical protein [Streptacidiphilus pinicola]